MTYEICLDANIFTSALTSEPSSDLSLTLLRRLDKLKADYFEPALIIYEVGSSFQKKVLNKDLSRQEAQRSLDSFLQFPLLLQWQDYHMRKAAQFAKTLRLKNIYDASYLAVAESREIPLVTLDYDFYKKGRKVYKNIFTVENFLKRSG